MLGTSCRIYLSSSCKPLYQLDPAVREQPDSPISPRKLSLAIPRRHNKLKKPTLRERDRRRVIETESIHASMGSSRYYCTNLKVAKSCWVNDDGMGRRKPSSALRDIDSDDSVISIFVTLFITGYQIEYPPSHTLTTRELPLTACRMNCMWRIQTGVSLHHLSIPEAAID